MPLVKIGEVESVGVERFDDHHEKMLEIFNELHEATKRGRAKQKVGATLEDLRSYSRTLFVAEEEAMEKFGYEGLQRQREEHRRYLDRIEQFQEELDRGRITVTMDVLGLLKEWKESHIRGSDAEYREFFRDKPVCEDRLAG